MQADLEATRCWQSVLVKATWKVPCSFLLIEVGHIYDCLFVCLSVCLSVCLLALASLGLLGLAWLSKPFTRRVNWNHQSTKLSIYLFRRRKPYIYYTVHFDDLTRYNGKQEGREVARFSVKYVVHICTTYLTTFLSLLLFQNRERILLDYIVWSSEDRFGPPALFSILMVDNVDSS